MVGDETVRPGGASETGRTNFGVRGNVTKDDRDIHQVLGAGPRPQRRRLALGVFAAAAPCAGLGLAFGCAGRNPTPSISPLPRCAAR
jgi:hypothetical protein